MKVALKRLEIDVNSDEKIIQEFIHEHSKNILIHQGSAMIADFVLSKQISEESLNLNSDVCGMPAYIDPNCITDPKYKRDKKSDIFSLGVIFWEISSGHPPFESLSPLQITIRHSKGIREEPLKDTLPQYVELI
ncbi:kinase-like domain-containing protein [Gigaspora rosea]|uniref:Kinase-like domain-containing protein n=1 Tax=Gigaspora rosea TaxID=44941 RepID=A0A397VMF5_9GLOM|nr:kinase-like domain-containing protein [Gigaspora rosea]